MWDVLGGDFHYNRKWKRFKLCMQTYITKIVEKFDVKNAQKQKSPSFSEKSLLDEKTRGKVVPNYPFRELVGCLQW